MSEQSAAGAPSDSEQAAQRGVHQLGVEDADAATAEQVRTAGADATPASPAADPAAGVLEVAQIEVTPGSEEDFLAGYRVARAALEGAHGCRSVRMTRGVESPSRFVLLVEWDSIEAHNEGFRGSERFAAWRAPIGPYMAAPPHVEHFVDVG